MQTTENPSYDPALSGGRSLSSEAARSSFFLFVAKCIRYLFVFIVQLILMNLLAPADFGLIRFVTIVIGVMNLINELGLSFAVVQKKTLIDGELSAAFSLNAFIGSGLYLLLFFLSPLVASFFGNDQLTVLIRVGAFSSFFGGLSVVHRSLLQRRLRYGRLALIEVVAALAGSAGALVMAIRGYGVWSLLASTFIFNLLSSLLLMITAAWPRGNYLKLRPAKSLFAFGGVVVMQRILDYGVQNIDYLVIGKWFGTKLLGIYSIAHILMVLPSLAFGMVIGSILLSTFSRMQDDNQRLVSAFLRVNVLTSIVSVPYFVLLMSFAKEMMHTVSFLNQGNTWTPATVPIKILALLGLLVSFSSYPGTIWIAKGKVQLRLYWEAIGLIAIIAAVLSGKPWGIHGICIALVVRGFLLFPVHLIITHRVVGLLPFEFLKALFPAFFGGLVMLTVTALCSKFVPGDSFKRDFLVLIMGSIGGITIYLLVLIFLFQDTWNSFKEILLSLRKSI
jgi:teichuronic acid exporter